MKTNNIKIVNCLLAYLNKAIFEENYVVSDSYVENKSSKPFTVVCNSKDFDEIFQGIISSEINGFHFHIKDFSVTTISPLYNYYITVDTSGNVYVGDDFSYSFCDSTTTLFIPANVVYKIPSTSNDLQPEHDNVIVMLNV